MTPLDNGACIIGPNPGRDGYCRTGNGYAHRLIQPPPIGDPLPDRLNRSCSYDPSLCGDQVCAKPAFSHADWNSRLPADHPDAAMGFNCREHHDVAVRAGWLDPPAEWHEVGPDCGMPGSRWYVRDDGSSYCRTPEDAPVFEAVEVVGLEVPA